MVAGMILLGGVTRLTRSGLSMVDWRPQGGLPPITDEEWDAEFAKYQQFPEYKLKSSVAKTVDDFKPIYYLEWGHRMWGRVIGLYFAGGALFFAAQKRIPRSLYGRLVGLFALGGAQGLVGWWMVKSGLEEKQAHRHEFATQEVRVSPYRLAAHLCTAFVTFGGLVWTGLDVLYPRQAIQAVDIRALPRSLQLNRLVLLSTALLSATVASGAFVAGNDAGCAYNTFPKMGDEWIPEGILAMEPVYRNFFENTACVQFDHRVLAMSTAATLLSVFALARSNPVVWKALPANTRQAVNAAVGMTAVQVTLGITTLLHYVPVSLAAMHQSGAVALLSISVFLLHSLRFARVGAFRKSRDMLPKSPPIREVPRPIA